MTTYPRGPKLLKGALIALDPDGGQLGSIVFQYNPETLRRSLQPQIAGGQSGEPTRIQRFTGAPVEMIDVDVAIDATDQLERGAVPDGIHPQLNALETLAYPNSQSVEQNGRLLSQGVMEIGPYEAPLTIFVWGPNRVLPVTVMSYSIQEQAFDTQLNPIRALISLNMRAISYSDVLPSHRAYHLFLTYQKRKETMARDGIIGSSKALTGVDPNRL